MQYSDLDDFYRRFHRAREYLNSEWSLDDIRWWGTFSCWSEKYWQAIGEKDPFRFRKWPKRAFKVYGDDLTQMSLRQKVKSWALIDRICSEPSITRFAELVQEYANCILECKYNPHSDYLAEHTEEEAECFLEEIRKALIKFGIDILEIQKIKAKTPRAYPIKCEYSIRSRVNDAKRILEISDEHGRNFVSQRSEEALKRAQYKVPFRKLIAKIRLPFVEVDAEIHS